MVRPIAGKSDISHILPEIRQLFGVVGLNVAAFDDDALIDAVVTTCPVVDPDWPTDEQLRRIFERLTCRRS